MKIKKMLFIVLLSALFSCTDDEIQVTPRFDLLSRQSNFMWADNLRKEIITFGKHSGVSLSVLKSNSGVKLSEYILGFNTCNVGISDIILIKTYYQDYLSSDNYDPLSSCPYMLLSRKLEMTDKPDTLIENRLRAYLTKKHTYTQKISDRNTDPDVIGGPLAEFIDYRLTSLTDLHITCSQDLFGIKAGSTLNDYFVIESYPNYHDFIISSNKQMVTGKTTGIGIAQYLSYSPMAPAAMYLQFKERMSISESVTAEFTVVLTLEGEKTISGTTKPITLTP
ncbi:MAG: hypothetical protein ACK5KP_08420 [Paludibacteraceae bacterium]